MKKKYNPLLAIALILFLTSCYGPNKAGKQVTKALKEYPEAAAELIRDEFPCTDGKADSTDFKASIDSLKKILYLSSKGSVDSMKRLLSSSSNQVMSYFNRLQHLTDSIKAAQKASGDDCSTLLAQTVDYVAQSNIERDSLKSALDSEKETRRQILRWVDNIKPVIQPVEDSAKIFLANRARNYWKAKYQVDHEWRVKQEKKMEGTLPLYPPWWLIIALAIISGLLIAAKIKKGVLNPFALFTKKNNT